MQTDIKEVKDLLSWRLVLLAIVVLLFCVFILRIRIENNTEQGFFKKIRVRVLSALLGCSIFLIAFVPLSKTFIPFLELTMK